MPSIRQALGSICRSTISIVVCFSLGCFDLARHENARVAFIGKASNEVQGNVEIMEKTQLPLCTKMAMLETRYQVLLVT